ncbi:hypothetical protein J2Z44_004292 [Clostridium punense]|uniref:PIN domain-containing protein n=1 Tax=Clostridium punense TaxID=1054297 RepID=A0ABS4K9G1_9CLOT|nr:MULTISPECIES: hypothetical protein [Clostridium]EQB89251.1 hypothetical protein M918_21265 [Clostridium sp. BL8]MBP2024423.1 hypothetical protein [Clostridium punense]
MYVRMFIDAKTESNAKDIYEKFIDKINIFIKSEKILKVEPYWKYENMYVLDTNILINCDIGSKRFEEFLYAMADKWKFMGIPIDEAVASLNMEGCKYIIEGINMINIFYY